MTNNSLMNNTAHLILQGKGGVGKSFNSSALAQYLIERGYNPACADTDPVNSTFHQIKDLGAALIPISEGGTVIQRLFDPLFESILTSDGVSVVDNGASTFLPMIKFISSNNLLKLMDHAGKQVFIHTVITGGQAKDDTVSGLISLAKMVKASESSTKIVIWQNDFWGTPDFSGKLLDQMPWAQENTDIIQGVVRIVDRHNDAFTTDIRMMTEQHLTCRQVMHSENFGFLAKSRVHAVFNDIYIELDRVFGMNVEE